MVANRWNYLGLVAVFGLLIPALASQRVKSVPQRAAILYQDAERAFQKGDLDTAQQILERAIQRFPNSGVYRGGGLLNDPYYPRYLLGVVYMDQGDHDAALEQLTLAQQAGVIQSDPQRAPDLLNRLAQLRDADRAQPVFAQLAATTVETVLSSQPGEPSEVAIVELVGRITEEQSLNSLTANGEAVSFQSTDGGFSFSEMLEVDPSDGMIELVATDNAGNITEQTIQLDLPPLDLGESAKGIHALIVGVDAYDQKGRGEDGRCLPTANTCEDEQSLGCYAIPDLAAAVADATRFYQLLVRRGVPLGNIQLLVSDNERGQATYQAVDEAITRLEKRSGAKVIFYFSGHGIGSKKNKNLMLLSDTQAWECSDTPPDQPTALEATSISVQQVEDALTRAQFQEKYIILDACRTPRIGGTRSTQQLESSPGFRVATRGLRLSEPEPEPVARRPVVFYATKDTNVSIEWSEKRAGYFTWYLIQGLRRNLPLGDLGRFVQSRVRERTRKNHCPGQRSCDYEQLPYLDLSPLDYDYSLQETTYILGPGPP